MRRLRLALVVLVVAAGCSTALLPRAEVPEVIRGAFGAAGLEVHDIAVAPAREGDEWTAKATVSGDAIAMRVDAEAGRITSIDLGESEAITNAQLQDIAGYASNPANDRARTRNRVMMVLVVVALVTVGLLVARHFRLREERELALLDEEH